MTIAALARAEIRDLQAYQAAAVADDNVKMHANEAPAATGTGETDGLNRYPAPRPATLISLMAGYYGVAEDNVWSTAAPWVRVCFPVDGSLPYATVERVSAPTG